MAGPSSWLVLVTTLRAHPGVYRPETDECTLDLARETPAASREPPKTRPCSSNLPGSTGISLERSQKLVVAPKAQPSGLRVHRVDVLRAVATHGWLQHPERS